MELNKKVVLPLAFIIVSILLMLKNDIYLFRLGSASLTAINLIFFVASLLPALLLSIYWFKLMDLIYTRVSKHSLDTLNLLLQYHIYFKVMAYSYIGMIVFFILPYHVYYAYKTSHRMDKNFIWMITHPLIQTIPGILISCLFLYECEALKPSPT